MPRERGMEKDGSEKRGDAKGREIREILGAGPRYQRNEILSTTEVARRA